jgi:hypothetical protein
MANDVFVLTDDLEISLYSYPSDAFIWNVTRWDDDSKWDSGSTTQSWIDFSGSVASVEISNGINIDQGLTRPDPATATIIFQNNQYDPFNNATVKAGTPIRIRVRPNPDTDPSTWVTLFQGKIDFASASYNMNWVNTVTLSCITYLRDYLNTSCPDGITTDPSLYAWNWLDQLATFYTRSTIYTDITFFNGYLLDGLDTFNPVNIGDIVNQLLDANLGALVYKPITLNPTVAARYYVQDELGSIDAATSVLDFEAVSSSNPIRSSFFDITIGYDTDLITNDVTATSTSGYGPINRRNDDSVALYGSLALEATTLHYNDADVDTWASQLTLAEPTRRVLDISADVIKRDGTVNTNLLREPMDVCNVAVSNANITIDENYFITRINYSFTPDQWHTTLELWKGR